MASSLVALMFANIFFRLIFLKVIYKRMKSKDMAIDETTAMVSPRKYEIADVVKKTKQYNKF
jgi:hypothetical protein